MIKIVRGNDIHLYVPMVQKNTDGTTTAIDVGSLTDLKVSLTKGGAEFTDFTTAITNNCVVVQLNENAIRGSYKMEITAKNEGVDIAYRVSKAFEIVEYNEESTFLDYIREDDGVTLDTAMFVAVSTPTAPTIVLSGVTVNSTDLEVTDHKATMTLSVAQKATPNTGYSATYQLLVNGVATGDDINIPQAGTGLVSVTFAMVTASDKASGGKFENDSDYNEGDPYLDFLLADNTHLYCNIKDAVKTYTAGNGLTLNNGEFAIDEMVVALKTDIPSVPTALSQLSEDSTHRTVTDTEKSTWNAKSDFSGSYNDLTDKPQIPSVAGLESTSNKVTSFQSTPDDTHYPSEKLVKDSLDAKQATIDSSHKLDYSLLDNTPTIPTVPTISTDISTDATSDTKTASPKAVKTYVDNNIPSVPVTDVTVGGMSVVSSGTAAIPAIPDTSNLIAKSSTAGLVKNDGTIDTTTYVSDISGKADKVSGATNGDLAGLDSNGNLTDSGITATSVSGAVTNSHTHSNKALLDTYSQTESNLADAVTKKHTHSNKSLLDMVPSSLGTAGQALCVNTGANGLEFKTVGGGGGSATDVQINGTSITSGGVANIVTETAYNASTNKIATVGDLPSVPTISTDIESDKASTTKTASPSAVYAEVHPATASSQPVGGMLPNKLYKLGTLSGSVSIALASPTDNTICNHYYFTFTADSTAPTITWDASITSWNGGSAPTITASKHYEVSVLDGVATFMEV